MSVRLWNFKVNIFWEGHKILRNLHQLFVLCTASQIIGGDFAKICGLLRIYELYNGGLKLDRFGPWFEHYFRKWSVLKIKVTKKCQYPKIFFQTRYVRFINFKLKSSSKTLRLFLTKIRFGQFSRHYHYKYFQNSITKLTVRPVQVHNQNRVLHIFLLEWFVSTF